MIYCTHCGAPQESGSPFCTGCGNQINTALPAPTVSTPVGSPSTSLATQPHPRRGRLVVVLATLVLLLGGGGVAAWAALTYRTGPPAPPGQLPDQPPAAAPSPERSPTQIIPPRNLPTSPETTSASAVCISSASQDSNGTTITYGPEKAVDGIPDTAWRCRGDGARQQLVISFPDRVTLTSIGIVPGYAKTDPHDGTDRYVQNRRISAVQYTFDDDSAITQSFDTSSSYRSIQTLALPNVSTSHVTITILSSVSGEATNSQQPADNVAISEVAVSTQ